MPETNQPPPLKGFSPASEDEAPPPAAWHPRSIAANPWFWAFLAVLLGIAFFCFVALVHMLEHKYGSPVRAHYSRVQADHRSLATAIECYYVDNNCYPAWTLDIAFALQGRDPGAIVLGRQPTFRLRHDTRMMALTTPVAYVTQYFEDPFSPDPDAPSRYYAVMGDPTMTGVTTDTASMWILWSAGPDERFQIDLPLLRRFARATPHQLTPEQLVPFTYDPTNGLESTGDVWRIRM